MWELFFCTSVFREKEKELVFFFFFFFKRVFLRRQKKTQKLLLPKVVALGLHEVGGQARTAVAVEVGEGAGHAWGGDAGLDGLFS